MPRKVKQRVKVSLKLNPDKGGGWLCEIRYFDDAEILFAADMTAWKNASAAKRYIKQKIQTTTPRKSIKLLPGYGADSSIKPVSFFGDMTYAVAA